MKVFGAVTSNEIKNFANECVENGSKITTDGHSSYRQLKEDYIHQYQNYYESNDTEFLKWLHIIISNAKAYISGTYHGLEEKNLQSYLDEFCYRFNRRFNTKQLFGRVLNACISGKPYVVPE
jgi:transposase-like protein